MVNGLPFWFYATESAIGDVPYLDPNGDLARLLDPQQVLGAVLLMTVQMDEFGLAKSSNTPTLSLGTVCEGTNDVQIKQLVSHLANSGIEGEIDPKIRQKVLVKLLANFTTNPLSALTGALLNDIGTDTALRKMATDLADEFRAWALSEAFDLPPNAWLVDLLVDAGPFPTSMLQDARAGKPLELDAICRAPFKLAQAKGLDMPVLDALLLQLDGATTLPVPKSQISDFLDHSPYPLSA
jgi:2-dehydropantoate 2-reductase